VRDPYPNSIRIRHAATPLRLIFWGLLICVLDFTFAEKSGGYGFRFDFLNDVVGTCMIAAGVYWLAEFPVSEAYRKAMAFAKAMSFLSIASAVLEHFVVPMGSPLGLLMIVVNAFVIAGIIVFCEAMCWLCESAALGHLANSWSKTFTSLVYLYAIPMGILQSWSLWRLYCDHSAGPVKIQSPSAFFVIAIALLLISIIPLLQLLFTLHRMREAADSRPSMWHKSRSETSSK
jgi:hypothetical protein